MSNTESAIVWLVIALLMVAGWLSNPEVSHDYGRNACQKYSAR